ncbi:asparagine synthase-related protein [Polymorphobacter sp.]|uniref:asparagine synthase-related protein n=1 Tax=Polymorphobacter sp. TaxID=1909290 RepID=UPI003F6F57C9
MSWAITGTLATTLTGPTIPTEAAGCAILATGHIAHRAALRRTLGLPATASDAEIFAHGWHRWRAELPRHILGEWALALHDPARAEALLAHDSLGTTPLYHAPAAGNAPTTGLRFATHLPALLDPQPPLDPDYIADYLANGFIASARTPFQTITRLLPGTSLHLAGDRLRAVRHWAVPDTPADPEPDPRARFRALLEDAVTAATDGATTVWTDLSGGLDSSSIASIAARLGAPDLAAPGLAAWSVYFPGHGFADERRFMQAVVDHHALPWHQLDASHHLPFAAPPAPFIGEPTITAINAALIDETRARQDAAGVDAVLNGHGGDLVLGAFSGPVPAELADPLFTGNLAATWRGLRAWHQGAPERRSRSFWLRYGLLAPVLQHLRGQAIAPAALPLQPWITADYARHAHLDARRRARLTDRRRTPGHQRLADGLHIAALQLARDRQRQPTFRSRSPLLHRPLVEFMAGLPFDQRTRPGCDRYLQRHALKGILPDPVRRRAGKGIATPSFAEGLSRAPEWVDWLATDSRLARLGIADPALWTHALRQAAVGQTHGDQYLHAGIALEIWLRQLEPHATEAVR